MSIGGIESIGGFQPSSFLPVNGTSAGSDLTAADGVAGASGLAGTSSPTGPSGPSSDFGDLLVKGIDSLEGMTDKAADLSVKAATGDLDSIHDYTIAASEAQLATQLTVAVRDKAVSAFQQIMQMTV